MRKHGGVGKRKMGSHKRKQTHKQAERTEFQRRHLDQIWEDVRKTRSVVDHKAGKGPVGTTDSAALDEDLPAHGKHYCISCSRYFVSGDAMRTHEATKPHKRQLKALVGARPHDQKEADWAGGMGAPDNGGLSMHVLGGVADIAL